jgi:hypothetical protein
LTLAELAPRLATPQVRALAWLIGSPGVLDARDVQFGGQVVSDAWCAEAFVAATPWLLALDRAPEPLLEFLAARTSRRVGRLAESLVSFWLRWRPGGELLAENLAVRGAHGTLGEFDFVFHETGQAQATHWETAVKFYLYRPEIGGLAGYAGPSGKDVLAAKTARIFDRQLTLGASAEGAAALHRLGVNDLGTQAWVKGWLFYPAGTDPAPAPGTNPNHSRGWWLRHGPQWAAALDAERRYAVLQRLDWLTWPWIAAAADTLQALAAQVDLRMAAEGESLLVVELVENAGHWVEQSRGFIVPADWNAATPA